MVRRRAWIIVLAVVIVPVVAVSLSLRQQQLYRAQAQVLLSSQNLAAELTGTQSAIDQSPDRIAQTQAQVARVPEVASVVLHRVPESRLSVGEFLAHSSVTPSSTTDILTFSVTNTDPFMARRLVDAYARAYTLYRRKLDTVAIKAALAKVDARVRQLVRAGGRGGALYASLVERRETLATMDALQTSNASVLNTADSAPKIAPRPARNGILGFGLGLLLGLGLAFLWEALDTRVRSAPEIAERLGLPLLARVPSPHKRLRGNAKLAMVEEPGSVLSETYRMLRTNLGFVTLGRSIRVIMVTSALEQEGKSTTIANLAVALARAGQRVAVVDLDLRRPYLDKLFRLEGPGITQVALGEATLDEALQPVPISDPLPKKSRFGRGQTATEQPVRAVLDVLPAGPIPPDPGEFIGTTALAEIMEQLRDRFDLVLVDAPPALHVGDAMALSTKVDGIVVVVRMKVVRRPMLNELARQLATSPTPVLGFVVTGADDETGYGDGYGYYGYESMSHQTSEIARSRGSV